MAGDDVPFQPELFVARDRARAFTRWIREALSERRLGYQGDRVGMETLVDRADEKLTRTLAGIADTQAALDAGRIRDRERGYMEVPLLVAAHTVALCVSAARRIERARSLGQTAGRDAERGVLDLLEQALARLDRFCAAYDEKQPVGPKQLASLERILTQIETAHRLEHPLPGGSETVLPFDRTPPRLRSDPSVLDDLLRAVRAELGGRATRWSVEPATPEAPLRLAIGEAGNAEVPLEVPPAVARAAAVLAHLHRVDVHAFGSPGAPAEEGGLLTGETEPAPDTYARFEIALADEAARGLDAVLAAVAGPEAALTPDAESAVRALLDAPPVPDEGLPSPLRMVALLGVLRALDAAIVRTLLPRAKTPHCRVAASQVPREKTRKAPVRRDLLLVLEDTFLDFPSHRVDPVATLAADGKLGNKQGTAADAAVLLAVLGRSWRFAGQDIRAAMDLAPLEAGDVEELIGLLGEIAPIRKDLEAGAAVDAVRLTTLERACIGVLGRIGRLA